MRRWALPITAVATVVGVALAGWWLGIFRLHDYVEFTPPPAQVLPRADCALPEITRILGKQGDDGRAFDGAGSIPTGFTSEKVVRCETGADAAGTATIDAVVLTGDIDSVTEAFRIRSRRTPDNVAVSCPGGSTAPVGLWLVAADGSAIRPQWPEVVCGHRDEPLVALMGLRQVGRTTVTRLGYPPMDQCGVSAGYRFTAVTAAADGQAGPLNTRPRLSAPTDDVGALTFCRYRASGEESVLTGKGTLSIGDSRRVVTAGGDASSTPACDGTATEMVIARLFRPDGSGGDASVVSVVACGLTLVRSAGGYNVMPADAIALLRRAFAP